MIRNQLSTPLYALRPFQDTKNAVGMPWIGRLQHYKQAKETNYHP